MTITDKNINTDDKWLCVVCGLYVPLDDLDVILSSKFDDPKGVCLRHKKEGGGSSMPKIPDPPSGPTSATQKLPHIGYNKVPDKNIVLTSRRISDPYLGVIGK